MMQELLTARLPAHCSSMEDNEYFRVRTAVLGTRHGKEQVIAPLLDEHLGIRVVVPDGFDTDPFGTFTRDVHRAGNQLEAARRKAEAAMDRTGHPIGLASEGSFGPHPAVAMLPANLELVVLLDRQHDLEIVGRHVSTCVVVGHDAVRSVEEALDWAARADFPEHGVVVRRGADDARGMRKGITDEAALVDAVKRLLRKPFVRSVFLETDLRAHVNPTRMAAIREAARDLVANAKRHCPACGRPGFAVDEVKPGLPCAWCGLPTSATLAHVYRCPTCDHAAVERHPHGADIADPGQCPFCNP